MKKTTKAVLASAFIFPGTGQLLLKRRLPAAAHISAALLAIIVILRYIISTAMAMSERVLSGELEPNVFLIRKLITEEHTSSNISLVNIATWVLVTVWLISIFDAYRSGKAQEQEQKNS